MGIEEEKEVQAKGICNIFNKVITKTITIYDHQPTTIENSARNSAHR
jgi:L-amino acid N-acyltransferase YncA